jgi:hypothetical protein
MGEHTMAAQSRSAVIAAELFGHVAHPVLPVNAVMKHGASVLHVASQRQAVANLAHFVVRQAPHASVP